KAQERTLARDQLALDQVKATKPAIDLSDGAAVKNATLGLAGAQDELAQAQQGQQRAQERLDTITKSPGAADATGATEPAAPQAAIREAQHRVDTQQLNLQDAQAQQAALADGSNPDDTDSAEAPTLVSTGNTGSIAAAQAQLKADQAKLDALQSQVSSTDIKREETRASLMRDQANKAAADAQPVVVLTAPFDATVTDLGVTLGQAIVPQSGAGGSIQTLSRAGGSGQANG